MGDVVSLKDYKKSKEFTVEGRIPLYISHSTGKISGKPGEVLPDLKNRIERIRESLDNMNRILAELKAMQRE